ncbi:MAG TPA: DUF58 domain-containing protein [Gammaproteobacteria bacterium]|nr:DUF58 domain-containing protein [Gammaproteobacteria bacterium]
MNLSRRTLLLAALVVLAGIAGQWLGTPWDGVWRYPAVLLAGALVLEAVLTARTGVTASVSPGRAARLGETFSVTLELGTAAPRPLRVEVAPDLPALAPEQVPPAMLVCRRDAPAALRLRLSPARLGAHRWPPVPARVLGPLGLAWWPRRLDVREVLRVMPGRLATRVARGARAGGRQAGGRSGEGLELRGLRDYRAGDPVRRIDWKVSARRGRTVVREYEDDARLSAMILLDAGRTSSLQSGRLSRLGHYVNAAARLAELAARGGDEIGLVVFAAQPLAVLPPRAGTAALARMHRILQTLDSRSEDGNPLPAAVQVARVTPRRSLVLLLTDLDEADAGGQIGRAVRLLGRQHLTLVGALRDPELDRLRRRPAESRMDPYASLAALGLEETERDNQLALARLGAQVVRAPPASLEAALMRRYALLRRRRAV